MKQIQIGKSNLKASTVALGCWRMQHKTVEEATELIETAHQVGINYFDHADIYGDGKSEEIFGQALKKSSIHRDQILIQSKVGICSGYYDHSKEHILSSVDQILSRLQVDFLDVLLLHRPDTLMEAEEVAAAFDDLYQTGKVRHFGVSNYSTGQIEYLKTAVERPLEVNQVEFGPAYASLIDQQFNVNLVNEASVDRSGDLLNYSRIHQMTLQPWSPFHVNLQEGLFMKHPDYQQLTETLARYADQYGVSFEAMVIAWILRHPAQMQPLVGSMNPARVEAIAKASEVQLTRPEWYEIYRSTGKKLP